MQHGAGAAADIKHGARRHYKWQVEVEVASSLPRAKQSYSAARLGSENRRSTIAQAYQALSTTSTGRPPEMIWFRRKKLYCGLRADRQILGRSVRENRNIARIVICAASRADDDGVRPTIALSRSGASPKSEHQVGFPADLYARSIPADNPQTPAKIALGQALFVEQRLSADNLQHCEGCHNYALGFTDQKRTSVGIDNQTGRRNAPTILNAMFNTSLFWDGRAATLEEQAKSPILNPIEMGMKSPDEVVAKIQAMPQYREAFERVFGREVNFDDIAARSRHTNALNFPSTRRSITMWPARATRSIESAKRGWKIFNGAGRCITCHAWSRERPSVQRRAFPQCGRIGRRGAHAQRDPRFVPTGKTRPISIASRPTAA